jgi:hypothetical protein
MAQRGTVERAFELARGGECHNVGDIRHKLKLEGYSSYEEHLAGTSIKKQLLALMKADLPPVGS